METRIVGIVTPLAADILGICLPVDTQIYLGKTNIIHMESEHPDAYAKYGTRIPEILAVPDYIRLNKKDASIEYVKEFEVNGRYVKVAVRLSSANRFFARTLYVLNADRVRRFIESGELKPYNA